MSTYSIFQQNPVLRTNIRSLLAQFNRFTPDELRLVGLDFIYEQIENDQAFDLLAAYANNDEAEINNIFSASTNAELRDSADALSGALNNTHDQLRQLRATENAQLRAESMAQSTNDPDFDGNRTPDSSPTRARVTNTC